MKNGSAVISNGILTDSHKVTGISTDFPIEHLPMEFLRNFHWKIFKIFNKKKIDPDLNGGKIQIFFEYSDGKIRRNSDGIFRQKFSYKTRPILYFFHCSFHNIEKDRERGSTATCHHPTAAYRHPTTITSSRRHLSSTF